MSNTTEKITDLEDDALNLAAGAGLDAWHETAQAGMMSQQPNAQGVAADMARDKPQYTAIRGSRP